MSHHQIYISYDTRSNAKYIINNIYKKLIANGYSVLNELTDKNNINIIDAKIKSCNIFIWAVSNEYLVSDFYMNQFKLAISINKKIIQVLVSENIDLSLLPDELDGILDKQEIVEIPNNPNAYFEIIHTIGKMFCVKKNNLDFCSIKTINYEKTFELKKLKNLTKIFDANHNEIIGVESNPFRVHVFSKDTFEFKHTAVNTHDYFLVTDICKLNGFDGNILIIGSDKESCNSYIYIINCRTFEIINQRRFEEIFDAKGLNSVKAKKKYFNSCAECTENSLIYILENYLKANVLVFNYSLELVSESIAEIPAEYSNIFMRKLTIINNCQRLLMTNSVNNCVHVFDLNTLMHINVFSESLDMNIRALYADDNDNVLTLSWNNPCNGFNVFKLDGTHAISFNLPFNNKENRLFIPIHAMFVSSNQMMILDGNYTNLLHLYSIEYF
jgi:hypothetical protein